MGNTITLATALQCIQAIQVSHTSYSCFEHASLIGRLSLQTAPAHSGVNEMLYFSSAVCQGLFVGTVNITCGERGRSSPIKAVKIVI